MNRTHFLICGAWVDAINTVDAEQITKRRQDVANRYGVDIEAVEVVPLEQLQYR